MSLMTPSSPSSTERARVPGTCARGRDRSLRSGDDFEMQRYAIHRRASRWSVSIQRRRNPSLSATRWVSQSPDARLHLREGQRIGIDALEHRQHIAPSCLRRLGARDARVLEDAAQDERAIRRRVAAVANDPIGARLAQRAVDGSLRVAGELRRRARSSHASSASMRNEAYAFNGDATLNEGNARPAVPSDRRRRVRRGRGCGERAVQSFARPSNSPSRLRRSASRPRAPRRAALRRGGVVSGIVRLGQAR